MCYRNEMCDICQRVQEEVINCKIHKNSWGLELWNKGYKKLIKCQSNYGNESKTKPNE